MRFVHSCILTNKPTSPSEADRTLPKACVEQPIYFWQNQNCCHLQLRITADDGNRNMHFQSAPKHLKFIKSVASHHMRLSSSPLGVPCLPLPSCSALIAGLPAFLKNQLHYIVWVFSINYKIFENSTVTTFFLKTNLANKTLLSATSSQRLRPTHGFPLTLTESLQLISDGIRP